MVGGLRPRARRANKGSTADESSELPPSSSGSTSRRAGPSSNGSSSTSTVSSTSRNLGKRKLRSEGELEASMNGTTTSTTSTLEEPSSSSSSSLRTTTSTTSTTTSTKTTNPSLSSSSSVSRPLRRQRTGEVSGGDVEGEVITGISNGTDEHVSHSQLSGNQSNGAVEGHVSTLPTGTSEQSGQRLMENTSGQGQIPSTTTGRLSGGDASGDVEGLTGGTSRGDEGNRRLNRGSEAVLSPPSAGSEEGRRFNGQGMGEDGSGRGWMDASPGALPTPTNSVGRSGGTLRRSGSAMSPFLEKSPMPQSALMGGRVEAMPQEDTPRRELRAGIDTPGEEDLDARKTPAPVDEQQSVNHETPAAIPDAEVVIAPLTQQGSTEIPTGAAPDPSPGSQTTPFGQRYQLDTPELRVDRFFNSGLGTSAGSTSQLVDGGDVVALGSGNARALSSTGTAGAAVAGPGPSSQATSRERDVSAAMSASTTTTTTTTSLANAVGGAGGSDLPAPPARPPSGHPFGRRASSSSLSVQTSGPQPVTPSAGFSAEHRGRNSMFRHPSSLSTAATPTPIAVGVPVRPASPLIPPSPTPTSQGGFTSAADMMDEATRARLDMEAQDRALALSIQQQEEEEAERERQAARRRYEAEAAEIQARLHEQQLQLQLQREQLRLQREQQALRDEAIARTDEAVARALARTMGGGRGGARGRGRGRRLNEDPDELYQPRGALGFGFGLVNRHLPADGALAHALAMHTMAQVQAVRAGRGGRGRGRGRRGRGGRLTPAMAALAASDRDFTDADYEALLQLDEVAPPVKNKGKKLAEIRKLPKETLRKGNALIGQQCSICLENFVQGCSVRKLPCSHAYHLKCIDTWLQVNAVCPVDKTEIWSD